MYGLVLFHDRVVDISCRVTQPPECAACAGRVVEGAAIVMPELHDHIVSGFELPEYFIPMSFRNKGPAAAAAEGEVTDGYAGGVKRLTEEAAPAPETAIAFA